MTNAADIFGIHDAAAYLKMNLRTVQYHAYVKKDLKPDATIGRSFVFTRSTLDAFKQLPQKAGKPRINPERTVRDPKYARAPKRPAVPASAE